MTRSTALAIMAGAVGVGYRLAMSVAGTPTTDSDESTIGLAALHIGRGGHFPAFFYGQYYLGALEAYLAAPLVAAFGPHVIVLRVVALALFAGLLAALWALARSLVPGWFPVAVVAVLALGSEHVLKVQMLVRGGYPEITLIVALLFLLGFRARARLSPSLAFAWGGLAGLAVWDHWVALPYVFAAGVLLLVAAGWRLLWRPGFALLLGLVTGAAPLLYHNLTGPPGTDSWTVFGYLRTTGSPETALEQVRGGFLIGVPAVLGMCRTDRCEPWQQAWAVGFVALVLLAATLALRRLVVASTSDGRLAAVLRLLLLGAAAATLASYVSSDESRFEPYGDFRYLACLVVTLPVVLEPLWLGLSRSGPVWRRLGAGLVAASLVGAMLAGTVVTVVRTAPDNASVVAQRRAVLAELRRLGVDRVFSEYWTCNWLTYATGEEIICAIVERDFGVGINRWPAYWDDVALAPGRAYLFPRGWASDARVEEVLRAAGREPVRSEFAGYVLWRG